MLKFIRKLFRNYVPSPVVLTFIFGILTLSFSFTSLFIEGNYKWGLYFSSKNFEEFSELLFNSVQLLIMRPPADIPENNFYSWAQLFSVLLAIVGIGTILWESSKKFRDFLLKWYWRTRANSVVIIGLGRIGLPLAKEIQQETGPVYAIELNAQSDNTKKAQRNGILVVEGDATDPDILERLPLKPELKIFIATGNDSRNIEIAGLLQDLSPKKLDNNANQIHAYVHISNAKTRSTLRAQTLLSDHDKNITFSLFSTPNTTARNLFNQLFLDQHLGILSKPSTHSDHGDKNGKDEAPVIFDLPGKDEAYHLFIFGFGEIGQSIALHAAHFAHFESCLRPRITIFDDAAKGMNAWKIFTDQYSAFSPKNLDLASEKFLQAGDSWEAHHLNPNDAVYQKGKENRNTIFEIDRNQKPDENGGEYSKRITKEEKEQEFRILQNHAVEYAAHAEYKPILTDVESSTLLDKITARLSATNPKVKAALIFCSEDERKNFNDALRLQQELARRLFKRDTETSKLQCCDQDQESQFPIPLFVLLPVEKGLSKLLDPSSKQKGSEIDKKLPIYSFGEQHKISTYETITDSKIKNYAAGLREVYETISGKKLDNLADFESSDLEAALFTEVKLKTLGITFKEKDKRSASKGIFAEYYTRDVEQLYEIWAEKYGKNRENKLVLPYQEFEDIIHCNAEDSTEMLLLERLLLLQQITIEGEADSDGYTLSEAQKHNIPPFKSEVIKKSIKRFQLYVEKMSEDGTMKIDLDAKMEHNRWMGERLSKNWKFGRRDKHRRQRESFVPWKYVPEWNEYLKEELFLKNKIDIWRNYNPEDMKIYDRQQLPRLILALREDRWCAYIDNKSTK